MTGSLDGATTALQRKLTEMEAQWKADVRRIEELTAELEQARDPAREATWAERFAVLTKRAEDAESAAATERAAREQAEAALQRELNRTRGGMVADLMIAERERDTALARVKELEGALCQARQELHPVDQAQANEADALVRAQAAETALASARKLPALWRSHAAQYAPGQDASYCVRGAAIELEEALTSHPSPAPVAEELRAAVAAGEAEYAARHGRPAPVAADVCGKKCDHGSECLLLRGHDGGHDTQHGCTFYDPTPVAAPCAGCATWSGASDEELDWCRRNIVNMRWLSDGARVEIARRAALEGRR